MLLIAIRQASLWPAFALSEIGQALATSRSNLNHQHAHTVICPLWQAVLVMATTVLEQTRGSVQSRHLLLQRTAAASTRVFLFQGAYWLSLVLQLVMKKQNT